MNALPHLLRGVLLCLLIRAAAVPAAAQIKTDHETSWDAGLLFDNFPLTLASGHREEAAGPFYYHETQEAQDIWAVPPILSYTVNPELESKEVDFLYPVMSYDRYGDQYRWHFFQVLSFAGGVSQTETNRDRFTLYPVYFQQRSSDPSQNYTALVPFYGDLQYRLNRDRIHFVMFPLYSQTEKRGVITDNYLYPVFHLRHGPGLQGWQVWPLVGHEHKEVTTRTNRFGDRERVGGHDRLFALWPLFSNQRTDLGTPNPKWQQAVLPVYFLYRSPLRDQTTIIWPLFSRIEDRDKGYVEWQAPWPLVAVARGPGKHMTRVLPFFGYGSNSVEQVQTYAWPIYRRSHLNATPLYRDRTRILFFLYSDVVEGNNETGKTRKRRDVWPLFTRRVDWNGNSRLQVLSLIEPIVPANKSIERNYSHLYSLWRAEHNPQTRASSSSLLWNLYRRESSPEHSKTSLLFGLFQFKKDEEGKHARIFYIPL